VAGPHSGDPEREDPEIIVQGPALEIDREAVEDPEIAPEPALEIAQELAPETVPVLALETVPERVLEIGPGLVPEIAVGVRQIAPAAETGRLRSVHRPNGRKPKPHLNSVHRPNGRRMPARRLRKGAETKAGAAAGTQAVETKPVAVETEAGVAAKAGGTKGRGTSQEDNGSSQRNLNHRRSRIQTVEATRALRSGGLLSFLISLGVSEPEHGLLSY
jgi:hypothetical protein